jgi:lactoylglutathione lyase
MKFIHGLVSGLALFAIAAQAPVTPAPTAPSTLGNFSVSLNVRDLAASKAFYEKLGFIQGHGDGRSWAVMKNGAVKIGLFQGMFERNSLTFNPGWDSDGNNVAQFDDVRVIQRRLRAAGLEVGEEIASATGPAYFTLTDPDGNPVLFDQHR